MRVHSVKIRNLRSIEELTLETPANLISIVGANSAGKSNLFRAFELFLCNTIDLRPFNAALDMPAWIIQGKAPSARTSIQLEFDFSGKGDDRLWASIEKFHNDNTWPVPVHRRFTIVKYFSRSNRSGFQCIVSGQGTRSTESESLGELVERIIRKIEYRYVPSLKDLQSTSFRLVSEELKKRLLSIWAGSDRKTVTDKRDRFQGIRKEIEQLIQDAAVGLSESLTSQFPEVATIKLAMASTDLEDMIGNLDIFANDGHETLMRQKGSGVQGASIIHMLRILRNTAPRGIFQKRLFLWNIEEPETFLHPAAQRKLADLFRDQSKNTQILLTTHSPIFVDRKNPRSNILFRRERSADNFTTRRIKLPTEDALKPIRQSLGTSLSDSLALHEVVVLVEGPSDSTIFSRAFERLCERKLFAGSADAVAFVSCHGASQQATSFSILKGWSPLSRLGAIFDYDKAGREDGARRLRAATEDVDYFFLPHGGTDVALEDLYPETLLEAARNDGSLAQIITTEKRPNGEVISESVQWNKDKLAQYFCDQATDDNWRVIEQFVLRVVALVSGISSPVSTAGIRARSRTRVPVRSEPATAPLVKGVTDTQAAPSAKVDQPAP